MPRPRERVCLQDGLKLDLNRLARNVFIRLGARSNPWNPLVFHILGHPTGVGPHHGRHEWPSGGMVSTPRRFQRADYASRPSPTFRRPTMVFHVPRHERASVGTMEATGRKPISAVVRLGGDKLPTPRSSATQITGRTSARRASRRD